MMIQEIFINTQNIFAEYQIKVDLDGKFILPSDC